MRWDRQIAHLDPGAAHREHRLLAAHPPPLGRRRP
jgi:hypothetical protein